MVAVEAVIFDLGRVLVDVVIHDEFKKVMGWPDQGAGGDGARAAFDDLYRHFSTGKMSPAEFHRSLVERLRLKLGYDGFVRLWCSVLRPLKGAEEMFEAVTRRFPAGLLSDTDPVHWNHVVEQFPFVSRIQRPTLSFRTGRLKPARAAYLAACENVGRPPERCLFIDDKPENVEGAKRVGMEALVFDNPAGVLDRLAGLGIM